MFQTWEWGQFKSQYGWQPVFLTWRGDQIIVDKEKRLSDTISSSPLTATALVLQRSALIRKLRLPIKVLYLPKGPGLNWDDIDLRARVLDDLQVFAKQQGATFIKIDPDVSLGSGIPDQVGFTERSDGHALVSTMKARGWLFSPEQIQFRNTVILDLNLTETELLERMKQKTRYNINLSRRKGVAIRAGTETDLGMLYRMYAETSVRDRFIIREEDYYVHLWRAFMQSSSPTAHPWVAEVEGEPVAGIVIFRFGERAWFLHGMSSSTHREKMPNYLLQWEAMRHLKATGGRFYDLWGAPDEFKEDDPLWGVYRFKEGLGGNVIRTIGAWDWPVRPRLYRLYTRILPRILGGMRRRRATQTRSIVRI